MNELASRLRAQPEGDLTLAVAAAALGIGVAVAYSRVQDTWADFPLLLLVALPCLILFGLTLAPAAGDTGVGAGTDGRIAPWQTACLLIAIPLFAASILLLIKVLGKVHPGTGTATWVLLLTGLIAAALSVRIDSPGATLLAAIALAGAPVTAVNWIDSGAPLATYRDVLLLEGVIFLFLARTLWVGRLPHAKLLVAVGGVTLIAGAAIGNGFQTVFAPLGDSTGFRGKDGWTFVLIVVTIGLLAFAAWQRHGGTAFVGLVGAYYFLILTASGGDLSGWPLILGVVALLCLIWALVVRPSRQAPGAGAMPHAPQPPP